MYHFKLDVTKKEHMSFFEEMAVVLKGRKENWVGLEGNVLGKVESVCKDYVARGP